MSTEEASDILQASFLAFNRSALPLNSRIILCHPADSGGCFFYRIRVPAAALAHYKIVDRVVESQYYLPDSPILMENGQTLESLDTLKPLAIITQRQVNPPHVAALEKYLKSGFHVVHDLDDMLWKAPHSNPYINHFGGQNLKVLRKVVNSVSRNVVSTEPLQEALYDKFRVSSVVSPNLISGQFFKPPQRRSEGNGKMRVGWAGSSTHADDLAPLLSVVRGTKDVIDWVFLGWCPDSFRGIVEILPAVPVENYVHALNDMNLDVAIAPLALNSFNECKSNLKLVEFSAIGIPVVCTDIYPYKDSPGVLIKRCNTEWRDWGDALRAYAGDEELRLRDANKHFQWAHKFRLETPENIKRIADAWLP